MSSQAYTSRITVKQVINAYKKKKLKSIAGEYFDNGACCPIVALVHKPGIDPVDWWDYIVNNIHRVGVSCSDDFLHGFMDGVDGHTKDKHLATDEKEYEQGHKNGERIWNSVAMKKLRAA